MTTKNSKELDLIIAGLQGLYSRVEDLRDGVQEQIDDLEDKQSERESEARQAKIDALGENLEALESVLATCKTLSDDLNSAMELLA